MAVGAGEEALPSAPFEQRLEYKRYLVTEEVTVVATLIRHRWTSSFEGMSRRDRQGCDYDAYLPVDKDAEYFGLCWCDHFEMQLHVTPALALEHA